MWFSESCFIMTAACVFTAGIQEGMKEAAACSFEYEVIRKTLLGLYDFVT